MSGLVPQLSLLTIAVGALNRSGYSSDWRLVFRRGDEVPVPQGVWLAFER
jgi:hypothetical protein